MGRVERTDLWVVVERALSAPVRDVGSVAREPIGYDSFLAGRSLTRIRGTAVVKGTALVNDRRRDWSVIEKVTDRPGVASEYLYDNGRRELCAYRSGLLTEAIPGFAAATAYATTQRDDGSLVLHLEDLADASASAWTAATYLDAARHLGRFGGRWLGCSPEHAWLFQGWIERHSQPLSLDEGRRLVGERMTDVPPLLLGVSLDEALRLLDDQQLFRSNLERLPQTLCHHDAVGANLFSRNGQGERETLAIDWEMLGPGAVGADLASLLFASVRRGDLSVDWLTELAPRAVETYRSGLADMGASVDSRTVHLGFVNAVALRWALLRDVLVAATTPDRVGFYRGSAPDESSQHAMEQLVGLTHFLIDAARAARGESPGFARH